MSVIPKSPPPAIQPPPAAPSVASTIAGSIQRAAQATGASFEYLLSTAKVESNLNPNSAARGSSATGLFQFIEQTWLGVMKSAGRTLGLGNYADAITQNSAGRYQVADPRLRNAILQMRKDPAANAALAGAFTQRNAAVLNARLGRPPTDGELYMAHFFGTGGAARLINAASANPQANATGMFPAAARANRSIFHDAQGRTRSAAGVYSELDRRYQVARARVMPEATRLAAASAPSPVSDPAGTTSAFAAATADSSGASRPTQAAVGPIVVVPTNVDFHSLFHTGGVRGAVAPVVAELWGAPSRNQTATAAERTTSPQAPSGTGTRLDLFRDSPPDARSLFTGNGRG